jgi:hypothetical protein
MAARAESILGLAPGRTYTWAELGARCDFKPRYLSVAGGMMPRPHVDDMAA